MLVAGVASIGGAALTDASCSCSVHRCSYYAASRRAAPHHYGGRWLCKWLARHCIRGRQVMHAWHRQTTATAVCPTSYASCAGLPSSPPPPRLPLSSFPAAVTPCGALGGCRCMQHKARVTRRALVDGASPSLRNRVRTRNNSVLPCKRKVSVLGSSSAETEVKKQNFRNF